jgi:hypothetical protein
VSARAAVARVLTQELTDAVAERGTAGADALTRDALRAAVASDAAGAAVHAV